MCRSRARHCLNFFNGIQDFTGGVCEDCGVLDVTLFIFIDISQRFGDTDCFHLQLNLYRTQIHRIKYFEV